MRTRFAAVHESAIGPKRTSLVAAHVSAFGGKADMTFCGNLLSRSLFGVKRTRHIAPHMSAYDPKRTLGGFTADPFQNASIDWYDALF